MPQQLTDPHTGRPIYRYSSAEMSGALPATLYKYLPMQYAVAMIERGELMFSTLAWFQNLEDVQRGDKLEGIHRF